MTGGGRSVRRRDVLGGLAGTTALVSSGACGWLLRERGLQVAVIWSGTELSRFRDVVRRYREPVTVISAGDDIDGFLRSRRSAGNTPDVAILSRPGLVRAYAADGEWLVPVSEDLGQGFDERWTRLARGPDGLLYGAWVKAAHKSLFWQVETPDDEPDPVSWDRLAGGVRAGAGGERAPLAIGADDGWVLTDWFENALAAQRTGSTVYDELVAGKNRWGGAVVRRALEDLTNVWRVKGAFPGGGRQALLTQHDEAVIQVVGTREASKVMAADFAQVAVDRFKGDHEVRTFRVPGRWSRGARPLVVGGDCAVVLRRDGDPAAHQAAENFIAWLLEPATFDPWLEAGGFLTPNQAVRAADHAGREDMPELEQLLLAVQGADAMPDEPAHSEGTSGSDPPPDAWHFDLSDQLPAAVGGGPGQGMWQVLQELFRTVTGVGDGEAAEDVVNQAITRAQERMARLTDRAQER